MALFYECIQKCFISNHSKLCKAHVNKLKDRRNFSLAELIWKGLVSNLALERRNVNNCLFFNSSRYIRLLVFLQLSGDKPNSQTEI